MQRIFKKPEVPFGRFSLFCALETYQHDEVLGSAVAMPKVGLRPQTPETPRMSRETLRRAALYNANPVGPYLKPKLTRPVDQDTLVRDSTTKGTPLVSDKPAAQQIQERERGHVQTAPGNLEHRPG